MFRWEMQIYMYNSDDFDSLAAAIREKRTVAAMAVFFQINIRPVKLAREMNCSSGAERWKDILTLYSPTEGTPLIYT
ncbi:unnamed protein product [Arctogadus glacialis]